MPYLIGITGKKFSGKSTLADIICKQHGAIELAFATPLKNACSWISGYPMEYFTDPMLKEKKISGIGTPRELMIAVGMFVRNFEENPDMPNYTISSPFVYLMKKKINTIRSQHETKETIIVISDLRFPDELKMLKKEGGVIIRVLGNHTPDGAGMDQKMQNHESETFMEEFEVDITIDNTGSVADLKLAIDAYI